MDQELILQLRVTPETIAAACQAAHALLGRSNLRTVFQTFQTKDGANELCICLPETLVLAQLDAEKLCMPDGTSVNPCLRLRFQWRFRAPAWNMVRRWADGLPGRVVDSSGRALFPPEDLGPLLALAQTS
jgi:hypothetical protein